MSLRQHKPSAYGGKHFKKKTRKAPPPRPPLPKKAHHHDRNDEDYINLGHKHKLTYLRYPTKRPPPKPKRLHEIMEVSSHSHPQPMAAPCTLPQKKLHPDASSRPRDPQDDWLYVDPVPPGTPLTPKSARQAILPPSSRESPMASNKKTTQEAITTNKNAVNVRMPPKPHPKPPDIGLATCPDPNGSHHDKYGRAKSLGFNGLVKDLPVTNANHFRDTALAGSPMSAQASKPSKQPLLPPSVKPKMAAKKQDIGKVHVMVINSEHVTVPTSHQQRAERVTNPTSHQQRAERVTNSTSHQQNILRSPKRRPPPLPFSSSSSSPSLSLSPIHSSEGSWTGKAPLPKPRQRKASNTDGSSSPTLPPKPRQRKMSRGENTEDSTSPTLPPKPRQRRGENTEDSTSPTSAPKPRQRKVSRGDDIVISSSPILPPKPRQRKASKGDDINTSSTSPMSPTSPHNHHQSQPKKNGESSSCMAPPMRPIPRVRSGSRGVASVSSTTEAQARGDAGARVVARQGQIDSSPSLGFPGPLEPRIRPNNKSTSVPNHVPNGLVAAKVPPVPRKRVSREALDTSRIQPQAKKPLTPPTHPQSSLLRRRKGGGIRIPLWKAPPPPSWTPPSTPTGKEPRREKKQVALRMSGLCQATPLSPPPTPMSTTSFFLPPFQSSDLSTSPMPSTEFDRSWTTDDELPVKFTTPLPSPRSTCTSPTSTYEFEENLFECKAPKRLPGFQQQLPINVFQELQNNLRRQISRRSRME